MRFLKITSLIASFFWLSTNNSVQGAAIPRSKAPKFINVTAVVPNDKKSDEHHVFKKLSLDDY